MEKASDPVFVAVNELHSFDSSWPLDFGNKLMVVKGSIAFAQPVIRPAMPVPPGVLEECWSGSLKR